MNKTLIVGDEYLFDLTTTSNVDEAYLYGNLGETEVIGSTIYSAYVDIFYEYNGTPTGTLWTNP